MDGVLVDSIPSIHDLLEEWSLHHGLDSQTVIESSYGRRMDEVVDEQIPAGQTEAAMAWYRDRERERARQIKPCEGAVELTSALAEFKWAVVTSGYREIAEIRLQSSGISVPEQMVCAEDVTVSKPDPQGYLKGIGLLGLQPSQVVVFEDAPSGVAAAKAAGATVIGITGTVESSDLQEADYIVDSLLQISVEPSGSEAALLLKVQA